MGSIFPADRAHAEARSSWYLLRRRSRMVDREEVRLMIQAAYEEAETKDDMALNLLWLLGYRRR